MDMRKFWRVIKEQFKVIAGRSFIAVHVLAEYIRKSFTFSNVLRHFVNRLRRQTNKTFLLLVLFKNKLECFSEK